MCFHRYDDIPNHEVLDSNDIEPSFWPPLERPDEDTAARRAAFDDILFLRNHRIKPCVVGDPEAAEVICAELADEGIQTSVVYLDKIVDSTVVRTQFDRLGCLYRLRSLNDLETGMPKFVVLATYDYDVLRRYIADLSTIKSCAYAFSSFSLALFEKKCATIVNFLENCPSPKILTSVAERGMRPFSLSASMVTSPDSKRAPTSPMFTVDTSFLKRQLVNPRLGMRRDIAV